MRELRYYVACSVDGFIAHEDGSADGFYEQHDGALTKGEHIDDFLESYKWFDIVLMGRKTYEFGLKLGVTNPYPTMRQYLFSRSMDRSPDENVELVSENAVERIREMKQESGKEIWLCGGANLATTLFAENLIDRISLKLNPLLLGSGIPLFSGAVPQTDLIIDDRKLYDNGVTLLHYKVRRRS